MKEQATCRWDRETKRHLTREHRDDCTAVSCGGCRPCTHDEHGNPVRHCRTRLRCTSHLGWDEHACPKCLRKIRENLDGITNALAIMPAEATERGRIDSEAANLAGPHADYVTAQWRLVNASRDGHDVEELDLRDPYTCLTMHERTIRELLGHDETTLVSETITEAASYLAWVLTDLSRDEENACLLQPLLGDTAALRTHVEVEARQRQLPTRGAPCPECVTTLAKKRETLTEAGVPESEWPSMRAPRLVRHYGHWCIDDGCELIHYLDESADEWVCPDNPEHAWPHEDYSRWIETRRTKVAT